MILYLIHDWESHNNIYFNNLITAKLMISEVYKSNIEMEINVTIGHRRFYLQVEKNANIIA